jgi:hypothetical protein
VTVNDNASHEQRSLAANFAVEMVYNLIEHLNSITSTTVIDELEMIYLIYSKCS